MPHQTRRLAGPEHRMTHWKVERSTKPAFPAFKELGAAATRAAARPERSVRTPRLTP
jgi:hypothetical protein